MNLLKETHIDESSVEQCVAKFPEAFLGRKLKLLGSQVKFGNRHIPDLVFTDDGDDNNFSIVEVQLGAINKTHLYKCLEYRDLLLDRFPSCNVRVTLMSERNRYPYEILVRTHGIEHIVLSVPSVVEKMRQLNPNHRWPTRYLTFGELMKKAGETKTLIERDKKYVCWISERCFDQNIPVDCVPESDRPKQLMVSGQVLMALNHSCVLSSSELRDELWSLDAWDNVMYDDKSERSFVLGIRDDEVYEHYLKGRLRGGLDSIPNNSWMKKDIQGRRTWGWDMDVIKRNLELFKGYSVCEEGPSGLVEFPCCTGIHLERGFGNAFEYTYEPERTAFLKEWQTEGFPDDKLKKAECKPHWIKWLQTKRQQFEDGQWVVVRIQGWNDNVYRVFRRNRGYELLGYVPYDLAKRDVVEAMSKWFASIKMST